MEPVGGDIYSILVQHAECTKCEVVDDLDTRQKAETKKEAGYPAERYEQIDPTEQYFAFVPNNRPRQVFDVHKGVQWFRWVGGSMASN